MFFHVFDNCRLITQTIPCDKRLILLDWASFVKMSDLIGCYQMAGNRQYMKRNHNFYA